MMATSPLRSVAETKAVVSSQDQRSLHNRQTIVDLVHGFAIQNVDSIMTHFADNALYCDIMGSGLHGSEARGKPAIRAAFKQQFAIAGKHTFVDSTVVADADTGFASWTLVLGDPVDPNAARFAGIDEFRFDGNGMVAVKKAWLKGIPRLRRSVIRRNPRGWGEQLRYLMSGIGV